MAVAAFGAELWVDNSSGVLTLVAEVLSVTPPALSRGSIDTTHHGSAGGIMTFIGSGVADPGAIPATIHYLPGSASDDLLIEWMTSGDVRSYKVVANASAGQEAKSGEGLLTSYEPDGLEIDGKQTAKLAIKASGPITQAAEA